MYCSWIVGRAGEAKKHGFTFLTYFLIDFLQKLKPRLVRLADKPCQADLLWEKNIAEWLTDSVDHAKITLKISHRTPIAPCIPIKQLY